MNKTLEKIYLTLYWRSKAYGYPPALSTLAESCNVSQTTIIDWLKKLARSGYIQLFLYENDDYNVKFLIEPKREWVINIEKRGNNITEVISEIPVKIYVHDGLHAEPQVYLSRKTLDKVELVKKGILA